jgi:PST family polysaccharide transporter
MSEQPADEPEHGESVRRRLGELMLKGGVVTLVGQLARGLVQIVGTLVLARLIEPEDYGIFGLTAVVMNLIAMFQEAGLTAATIQREEITNAQINSLFWMNIALTGALAGVLVCASPAVAWFYEEPRLRALLWVMTLALFINGARLQHRALMRRAMDFVSVVKSDMLAMVLGVAAAVAMGAYGMGYWALAGQQIVAAVVATGTTWAWSRWRPGRPAFEESAREMLTFGKNLTGFNFVNYFARNSDDYLIYYAHGARELGFYAKAYELLRMPLQYINAPLSAVAVPALSRLAGEPEAFRDLFLRIVRKVGMITWPLGAFMLLHARDLFVVMLGARWEASADIFVWLGLLVFTQPVSNAGGWLFITQDRTDEMLRWGILGSAMAIAAIAAGVPWGAEGVAAAYATTGLALRTPVYFWFVGRRGHVSTRDLFASMTPFVIPAAFAAAAMWALGAYTAIPGEVARLAAGLGVGGLVYALASLALPMSRRELADVRALAEQVRARLGG